MTDDVLDLLSVDKTLGELLAPIVALDEQLQAQEGRLDAELKTVREQRKRLKSVRYTLDPESAPEKMKQQKKKSLLAGRETIKNYGEILQQNAALVNGNGGFSATNLIRDFDIGFKGRSPSTVLKVLAELHDQGLIRLDHRGRGGAKYYKVVSSA